MKHEHKSEQAGTEVTRSYFPSGRWWGVWWQGRHTAPCSMWFGLTCDGGKMSGDGMDVIAAFTVSGEYSADGNCSFTKRYESGREVSYRGAYVVDGDRVGVGGLWTLGAWSERFWMEPRPAALDQK